MKKRILITGGAGFVGSNLAVSFKKKYPGTEVTALDNLKRRGSELNLARLAGQGVDFVHGDVRDPGDLAVDGDPPEVIIECSAEPSVLAGFDSGPGYVVNTNLLGAFNCLEAARRWNADVLFLSTSRVYPVEKLNSVNFTAEETRFELAREQTIPGVSALGITPEFPLAGHRTLYGATKLAAELLIEEYGYMYGLRAVINRCGVIAGPWQFARVDQGVFTHWLGSHYFKKPLAYFGYDGSGKQVRDLLHVDDLFELIDLQVENIARMDRSVFNVGGGPGISLSLAETTELCANITGNKTEVRGKSGRRAADIPIYLSDNSGVNDATGWLPKKGPVEILSDIFNWIRSNESHVRNTLFP
ncbi:MAG: NAD-dependent epimerase/dehydratase family protein [Thermodesulfobacteriota bacterium]